MNADEVLRRLRTATTTAKAKQPTPLVVDSRASMLERELSIPRFFIKKSKIGEQLTDAARRMAAHKARTGLLSSTDFSVLSSVIATVAPTASPPINPTQQQQPVATEGMLTWPAFVQARTQVPLRARQYFSASTFLQLGGGSAGNAIPTSTLLEFIRRSEVATELQLTLQLACTVPLSGLIAEKDFATWIRSSIATDGTLFRKSLTPHELAQYVVHATRRFFFLFPAVTGASGRLHVSEIASSSSGEQLNHVLISGGASNEGGWFSLGTFRAVLDVFNQLDASKVGALSLADLMRFNGGTLTRTFLAQLLQEVPTKNGRLEYPQFIDLVLALEHRESPRSLGYFFNVFDVKKRGYLTVLDIGTFYKAVYAESVQRQLEFVPAVVDVKDELFDMARPADPTCITLRDLINCGSGNTFVTMLIDFQGFWQVTAKEHPIPMAPAEATATATILQQQQQPSAPQSSPKPKVPLLASPTSKSELPPIGGGRASMGF